MLFLVCAALVAGQAQAQLKPSRLAPGFTLVLPSAARAVQAPSQDDPDASYVWTLKTKAATYAIASRALSEEELSDPVDRVLADYSDSKMDDWHAHLLDQKDLLVGGWPGIEARAKTGKGERIWLRCFLRERRSYAVSAVSSGAAFPVEVKSVMESVRFTGVPGVLKKIGPEFSRYSFPDTPVSVNLPGVPEVGGPAEGAETAFEHLAECVYGNRRYALAYRDGGDPAAAIEDVPEFVEPREDGQEAPKGKETSRRTYSLADHEITSIEFLSQDGKTYGRTDAVRVGDRTYFAVATVPAALKKSSEVERFFASLEFRSDAREWRQGKR